MQDEPGRGRPEDMQVRPRRHPNNWSLILLLPPFVALLYPPFYARLEPDLGGVPFFIWYQFAWVIVTAILTAVVYKLRKRSGETTEVPPPPEANPTRRGGREDER